MKLHTILKLKEYIGNRDVQKTHFKTLKKEIYQNVNVTVSAKELFDILYPEKIMQCENARFIIWSVGYRSCKKGCKCYVENLSQKISKITKSYTSKKKESILATRKDTVINKYGVENVFQLSKVKQKAKQTKLVKYGNENYNNRDRCKETVLSKYGVENVMQLDSVILKNHENRDYQEATEVGKQTKLAKYGNENYNNREQCKETVLSKYGVENVFQSSKIKQKAKHIKLEKYSDENYNNRDKAKQTCIEKYGVSSYSKTIECKEQVKKTSLEKYGVESKKQLHIPNETLEKLRNKTWLTTQHIFNKKSITHISNELLVDGTTVLRYIIDHNIDRQYYTFSYPEKQLQEYITETYNTKIITNNRTIIKPYEIDIYLPEYHLAIEYNGIYWHRPDVYGSKEQWIDYHQNKIDMCKSKGIQLLHLWENYGDHNALLHNAICGIIDNNLELIYNEVLWK